MWQHVEVMFVAAFANCEKRLLASTCLSARKNSASTGQMFMKFDIRVFFENVSREFKFD